MGRVSFGVSVPVQMKALTLYCRTALHCTQHNIAFKSSTVQIFKIDLAWETGRVGHVYYDGPTVKCIVQKRGEGLLPIGPN